jgi:hypothetical protein
VRDTLGERVREMDDVAVLEEDTLDENERDGVSDVDTVAEGECVEDGELDGVTEGVGEGEGEGEVEADGEADADGDCEAPVEDDGEGQ